VPLNLSSKECSIWSPARSLEQESIFSSALQSTELGRNPPKKEADDPSKIFPVSISTFETKVTHKSEMMNAYLRRHENSSLLQTQMLFDFDEIVDKIWSNFLRSLYRSLSPARISTRNKVRHQIFKHHSSGKWFTKRRSLAHKKIIHYCRPHKASLFYQNP
jgi:hypothetical protein